MKEAAAAEEYERAARVRDDLKALERALEKQAVVLGDGTDCDVIALAEDPLEAAVQIFYVRGGRIRGQRGWVLEKVEDVTTAGLVEHFLGQFYGEADAGAPDSNGIPREVLVPELPPDAATMTEWLSARRGGPVALRVPQRGDKKTLAETVARNALQALTLHKLRRAGDLTTRSKALAEIQQALGLEEAPLRIECYDVSNLQGTHVVASMVVFEDGLARKSEYRRFSIRGYDGTDDISAIREVITRRFRRYLAEREETGELDMLGDAELAELAEEDQDAFGGTAGGFTQAQIRLPPQPGGRRRWRGPGRGGRVGPGRAGHRRRGGLRPGQAAGGGVAARRGVPGHTLPHLGGALPAATGAGRGAPVRHHLPSGQARQGGDGVRARLGAGPRPGPAGGAAEEVRLGEGAVGGLTGGDRGGPGDRAQARGNGHGGAAACHG